MELSPEHFKAMLDDTQASLATSLARIEAFRIRERQLINELSQLRQQVHGHAVDGSKNAASAPPEQEGDNEQLQHTRTCSIKIPQTSDIQFVGTSGGPVYIADVDSEHPVVIHQGTKKSPASLVVTKDRVDFVELKARVRKEEFVGITTLKGAASRSQTESAKFSLLCCFAPPSAVETHEGAAACKSELTSGAPQGSLEDASTSGQGTWQMIWNRGGLPQRLVFEASQTTRTTLHRHTEKWLGNNEGDDEGATTAEEAAVAAEGLAQPRSLLRGDTTLRFVGEPSQILSPENLAALASVVPPLERLREWGLSYSTRVHGISLSTLYRKMQHGAPSLLIIKDNGGYVFGCYTPESWRIAPRYYGSGECFVFQLEPHRIMYPWRSLNNVKNDFFMYSTPECLAMGGLGHFAVHVDQELLQGSSGTCGTFGSPCLASKEDFKVVVVEVWQVLGG